MVWNQTSLEWHERIEAANLYQVPAHWRRQLKGITEDEQKYSLAMDGVVAERKTHPELFDKNDDRYYETIDGNRYFNDVLIYKGTMYASLYFLHNDELPDDEQYIVMSPYPGEEEWSEWHMEVNLYGYHL